MTPAALVFHTLTQSNAIHFRAIASQPVSLAGTAKRLNSPKISYGVAFALALSSQVVSAKPQIHTPTVLGPK